VVMKLCKKFQREVAGPRVAKPGIS